MEMKSYTCAFLVFMENVLFGGIAHGWSSLVFVLKRDHIFEDLCTDFSMVSLGNDSVIWNDSFPEKTSCDEQDSELNLVFSVTMSALSFGSGLVGLLYLKVGTRITRVAAFMLFVCGSLLVAFVTPDCPWPLFPGLSCVAIGGVTLLITSTQVSYLFPAHQSTVVGLISGAYDTSAGVQLAIKLLYDRGVSLKTSYISLCCLHVSVLVSTFFFLPKGFMPRPEVTDYIVAVPKTDPCVEAAEETEAVPPCSLKKPLKFIAKASDPSFWKCLTSADFLLHMLWSAILLFRYLTYMGSINDRLTNLLHNDIEQVSFYTNLSSYMMLAGIPASIMVGVIYDWQKRHHKDSPCALQRLFLPSVLPLSLGTCLGLLSTFLWMSSSLTAIITSFVSFVVFRAFLFAMMIAFISAVFPTKYVGVLYGLILAVASVEPYLQYAVSVWRERSGELQAEILVNALLVISLVHPAYQWVKHRVPQ